MPCRRTHQILGATSATGVALATSDGLPDPGRLVYCLGALAGGSIGGIAPDVLEPAIHGHHRDFFHSLSVAGLVSAGAAGGAAGAGPDLRARAAELRAARLVLSADDPRRTSLALREYAIYLLLGLAIGFAVGYVTHIAADLVTPRGVPVVSRRLL